MEMKSCFRPVITPNLRSRCFSSCVLGSLHHSGMCSPPISNSVLEQSQTQSGNRYTPHLTRFYASLGPSLLMTMIQESLESLNVKCKSAPREDGLEGLLRLRVGGYDRRKVMFKGWVDVEKFSYRGTEGSFCVMQRDVVCG